MASGYAPTDAGMNLAIKAEWLENAHKQYVDEWLRGKWGYARGWSRVLPKLVLWYAVAGSRRYANLGPDLNETADRIVRVVERGGPSRLDDDPRRTWKDALTLAKEVCGDQGMNPVDWFTGGCGNLVVGWNRLRELFGIRAKIASFILRDVSFLRDYSDRRGGVAVIYRRSIDRRWFNRLTTADQALFVPIDFRVHRRAHRHRASKTCARYDVNDIQGDPNLHRLAAQEIVGWARDHGFDPRDLDVYWYEHDAGNIDEEGKRTY